MSRRAGLRERWRAEVIRSSLISDSVRVVLLVLADNMTTAGYVSVPRSRIAETINRHEARVTERITKAIDAGLLSVVRAGRPGRTAEYHATFPDGAPVRTTDMVRSAGRRVVRPSAPPKAWSHGAHGWSTNTRAYLPRDAERTTTSETVGVVATSNTPKNGSERRAPPDFLVAAISPTDERSTA